MLKKDIPNGVILYEGPSQIDGSPIVVIANGLKVTKNRKLGDKMVQTWILRSDIHPNDALKSGDDFSVCGDCIHRGDYIDGVMTNRTCYVNLYKQGVFSIYNAFKRGSYPVIHTKYKELFKDKHLRIGSYGDPAAVPVSIWEYFSKLFKDYTGYTHLWRDCDPAYAKFCMASCENMTGGNLAISKGWRTFRVIMGQTDPRMDNEIACPAQTHGVHCDSCNLCNGAGHNSKNITVVFHGAAGRDKQYKAKIGAK